MPDILWYTLEVFYANAIGGENTHNLPQNSQEKTWLLWQFRSQFASKS
jgi:hypothetical protein